METFQCKSVGSNIWGCNIPNLRKELHILFMKSIYDESNLKKGL